MYTPAALLDAIVKTLILEKGEILVSTWFDSAEPVAIKNDKFIIYVPSEMVKDTLTQRFTDNVSEIIFRLTGEKLTPSYITGEDELNKWRGNSNSIYSMYTFENFIAGNSNIFARNAALAIANAPAETYNPLFIYGQSGLGKTHLLYAIAGKIRKDHPDFKIVYIKSDDFTNELVTAIGEGKMADFRNRYRQADLLLVDDTQFIAGKDRTQEEFFHTFNALYEAGKQIVLTSDRPPKEMYTLEERLRTRFEWGLIADIKPPDIETRMALVIANANKLGIKLSTEVTEFIATSIKDNVRQLEGAVKKVYAMHTIMGQPIDLDLVRRAIQDIFKENPGLNPTGEIIINEVASFYNVSPDKIIGKGKTKDIALARQVTMYLMREMTNMSLNDIGDFLNKDHSTVLYASNQIADKIKTDINLENEIKDMKKNIKSK